MVKPIVNGVLFQVGWILSVFYGNFAALIVAVIAATVYALFYMRSTGEVLMIALIVAVGITGDVILGLSAVLDYPTGALLPPFWMMTLWLLFATTVPWALRWLVTKQFWFVTLCVICGPLSYVVGVSHSDVKFGLPTVGAVSLLGLLWLVHSLFIVHLHQKWQSTG